MSLRSAHCLPLWQIYLESRAGMVCSIEPLGYYSKEHLGCLEVLRDLGQILCLSEFPPL